MDTDRFVIYADRVVLLICSIGIVAVACGFIR
jgi:hypothetical protein